MPASTVWHDNQKFIQAPQEYKKDGKSFQNRPLGPPWNPCWSHFGASWEASWAHAPKRLNFRGSRDGPGSPKWPTGLQHVGPRPSKKETQTPRNRCWKTSSFQHRYLKGSDVVFEAFLVGFSIRKCTPKTRNLILVKTSKIVIFL